MTFIPDDFEIKETRIPWFEEASTQLGIKGHRTDKSLDQLKNEIKAAMSSLGGGVTTFQSGKFPTKPPRFGYQITFNYGDREGRIEIAALPMKKETEGKRKQALKQALYTVREMLVSQFNSSLLIPGSAPLVPYMIDDKGRTLAEALAKSASIPLLSPPLEADEDDEVVEGEFRESDE
jgi:hypothetical protein